MPWGSGGVPGPPRGEGGTWLGTPPGGYPDPPGGVPDRVPPGVGGYLTEYPTPPHPPPRGVPGPPRGTWTPPGGYLTGYPPPGGYPGRTTEGVLTTRRAVCLLRSRRRTFLFLIKPEDFYLLCYGEIIITLWSLRFYFIFKFRKD